MTLSAWGTEGPWRERRGFDSIVQSVSGMAYAQGGDKPKLMPVSAIDYVSGYLMAFGALAALERRATEGGLAGARITRATGMDRDGGSQRSFFGRKPRRRALLRRRDYTHLRPS